MLYMRLMVEDKNVQRWIIVENSYDFNRDKKEVFLKEALKENRFRQFLDKIYICEQSMPVPHTRHFKELPIYQPYAKQGYYFSIEQVQRMLAISKMMEDNDQIDTTYVIICDLDEFFTPQPNDHEELMIFAKKKDSLTLARRKFMWDYNNISFRHATVPMINLGWSLIDPFRRLGQARFYNHELFSSNLHMVSEYHNCFSRELIHKKYISHPHPGRHSNLALQLSLKMNHSLISIGNCTEFERNDPIRCEMLDLESNLIPKEIKECSHMFTNCIDTAYKKNRSLCYWYNNWR